MLFCSFSLPHRPTMRYSTNICLIIGCCISVTQGMIFDEKISSNGLIFKPVGDIYKFKEMRKIITSIPQSYLSLQQVFMAAHINDLNELRKRVNNNENFDIVVFELNRLANSMEEINNLLTENVSEHKDHSRHRRAILPFVGNFIEWIFGKPDEDTVREILEIIRTIAMNAEETDRIVHNHAIFIRSLTDSIKSKNRMIDEEISNIILK